MIVNTSPGINALKPRLIIVYKNYLKFNELAFYFQAVYSETVNDHLSEDRDCMVHACLRDLNVVLFYIKSQDVDN